MASRSTGRSRKSKMFALIYWIDEKRTSVLSTDEVPYGVQIGEEVLVRYERRKYLAKILQFSEDKVWLNSLKVSSDGKIMPKTQKRVTSTSNQTAKQKKIQNKGEAARALESALIETRYASAGTRQTRKNGTKIEITGKDKRSESEEFCSEDEADHSRQRPSIDNNIARPQVVVDGTPVGATNKNRRCIREELANSAVDSGRVCSDSLTNIHARSKHVADQIQDASIRGKSSDSEAFQSEDDDSTTKCSLGMEGGPHSNIVSKDRNSNLRKRDFETKSTALMEAQLCEGNSAKNKVQTKRGRELQESTRPGINVIRDETVAKPIKSSVHPSAQSDVKFFGDSLLTKKSAKMNPPESLKSTRCENVKQDQLCLDLVGKGVPKNRKCESSSLNETGIQEPSKNDEAAGISEVDFGAQHANTSAGQTGKNGSEIETSYNRRRQFEDLYLSEVESENETSRLRKRFGQSNSHDATRQYSSEKPANAKRQREQGRTAVSEFESDSDSSCSLRRTYPESASSQDILSGDDGSMANKKNDDCQRKSAIYYRSKKCNSDRKTSESRKRNRTVSKSSNEEQGAKRIEDSMFSRGEFADSQSAQYTQDGITIGELKNHRLGKRKKMVDSESDSNGASSFSRERTDARSNSKKHATERAEAARISRQFSSPDTTESDDGDSNKKRQQDLEIKKVRSEYNSYNGSSIVRQGGIEHPPAKANDDQFPDNDDAQDGSDTAERCSISMHPIQKSGGEDRRIRIRQVDDSVSSGPSLPASTVNTKNGISSGAIADAIRAALTNMQSAEQTDGGNESLKSTHFTVEQIGPIIQEVLKVMPSTSKDSKANGKKCHESSTHSNSHSNSSFPTDRSRSNKGGRRHKPGEVEIEPESGVFVKERVLLDVKRFTKKPGEMVRRLLRYLVGPEALKGMTALGKGKLKPIPSDILQAVRYYVERKAVYIMDTPEFIRVINLQCGTLRNPNPRKATEKIKEPEEKKMKADSSDSD